MKINGIDWVAYVLTVVGGINWGLIGFLNFNLVDSIFGEDSALSRIIYALVGISAVYLIVRALQLSSHASQRTTNVDR